MIVQKKTVGIYMGLTIENTLVGSGQKMITQNEAYCSEAVDTMLTVLFFQLHVAFNWFSRNNHEINHCCLCVMWYHLLKF